MRRPAHAGKPCEQGRGADGIIAGVYPVSYI
jgi:hypothetical protein